MTARRTSRPPSSSKRAGGSKRSTRAGEAPKRTWLTRAIAIGVAVLILAAIAIALAMPRVRRGGPGKPIDVVVAQGESDAQLVEQLASAGVIDRAGSFALYLRAIGGAKAQPGRHLLSDDLSWREVVQRLRRSGDAARVKVTLPEGWNRFDISKRLGDKRVCDPQEFLAATTEPALLDELGLHGSAEGWLFPATYDLPADSDPREVVRTLVAQAHARIERLMRDHAEGAADLQRTLGWGASEVVVLASIVEKEAAVDEERPLIASVFLNRLRDPSFTPRLLQADPTAAYGCLAAPGPSATCVAWLSAGGGRPSAAIEHDVDNAWSTYTHEGLPPSPIASPGERSLAAVLAPAATRYLYFVARGEGHHTFSESLDAHNQAVKPK